MRSTGYKVKDIFSGCVCCSLANDLISGIREIQNELDPEWLIIETTGVAFPSNVSEALPTHLRVNAQITVIIDAGRWQRLRIPLENLIIGQLSAHIQYL
ncbi:MAG: GTP-binding protein [Dehalobacter sp. 4CP]